MSLLPPNPTEIEHALEAVIAARTIPIPLRTLINPDTIPEDILPWLAWAVSVDKWSPTWSLELKRTKVREAIAIARKKGTRSSIQDVIAAYGGLAYITEWWEQSPPEAPYTFALAIDIDGPNGAAPTVSFINTIIEEVSRTKPTRTHFNFTTKLSSAAAIGLKAVARLAVMRRLELTEA